MVTNSDTGAATSTGGFTYTASISTPTITSISPSSGSTAGGTSITITGTNFAAGATVSVGGNACTSVVVVSATSITCTTPAGSAGAKDVVVMYNGAAPLLSPFSFIYATPTPTPTPTIIGVIGFKTGSAKISNSAVKALTQYAVETKIIVTGYAEPTDPKGDFKLSLKRAKSVKAQLLKLNPKLNIEAKAGGTSYNSACASMRNKCVVIQKIGK